jgi:hypothetical protein
MAVTVVKGNCPACGRSPLWVHEGVLQCDGPTCPNRFAPSQVIDPVLDPAQPTAESILRAVIANGDAGTIESNGYLTRPEKKYVKALVKSEMER